MEQKSLTKTMAGPVIDPVDFFKQNATLVIISGLLGFLAGKYLFKKKKKK